MARFRVHRALLNGLLGGSLVGRTILGDLEEEYRARIRRDGRDGADVWFRRQARRLMLRELRQRFTRSSAWRRRHRSELRVEGRREARMWSRCATFLQDARYAARSVTTYRGRSVASVAMLALAIGIATAMFTIVDAVILRPVPFHDVERLAHVMLRDESGRALISVSPDVFRAWQESAAFEAVEAARGGSALVGFEGGEVDRNIAFVTPGVFDLVGGVRPLRGRLFNLADGRPGSDDRVLISETLWRSLYGADPSLIGGTIPMDGQSAHVVGVLPAGFRFPSPSTVIWKAESFEEPDDRPPVVYARFAADLRRDDALALATTVARDAGAAGDRQALARSLGPRLGDYYERVVQLLAGGVVLLFVVLCANVAGLMLGGLTLRVHELGMRTALGASRARLIRQSLLESSMIGAAGCVVGAGAGWVLVWALGSFLPQVAFVASLNRPDIDGRALAAASVAGFVATLGVGLLPAVSGTRTDLSRLLQTTNHATPSGRARVTTRGLLVCQVALSCTLVFGATLLVRSFVNLVNEDRGLDVRNVLTVRVGFPAEAFATPEARRSAANAMEDAVRAIPGVTAFSWSYGTPPRGSIFAGTWTSDQPGAQPFTDLVSAFTVDRSFFDVYRVPILRGRSFQPAADSASVLVSERFAEALWPGQDPIGRRFEFEGSAPFENTPFQVIGLVGELRVPSVEGTIDGPEIYMPFTEPIANVLTGLTFRCEGGCPPPARLRPQLRAAHSGVSIFDVVAPEDQYLAQFERPRAAATLGAAFAVTALFAAATGLFSLFSQSVVRRRRELGIRTALGAAPIHLRRLVWRECLAVILGGVTIAALASLLLTRVLSSLLFDVTTTDPLSWTIVVLTLAAATAAAAWSPTRSAVRTSPVALLRGE